MFWELLAARGAHQELLHTSFHLLLMEPTLLKPSTYIALPNFSVFYDYSIKLNCHTHNTAWLTSLDMFHQINVTLKRRCVIATSPVLTAGPFAGASSPFRHEASTIGIVNLRRIRPQRASILQESIGRILVIIRVTTKENTSKVYVCRSKAVRQIKGLPNRIPVAVTLGNHRQMKYTITVLL